MPFYNLPIEEIDESIIRPNITSIVKDVIEQMGFPENIKIMYRGNAAQYFYEGTEYDQRKYLDGHNRYSGDMLLYVETNIEDNPDRLINQVVHAVDERPIFGDYSIDLFMKPAYVNKLVNITFKLTGTEKEVERWRAGMRRRSSQGMVNCLHVVKYHYPIPLYFMYLLVMIYNMKKQVAPIPETLVEYLDKCFIKPFTIVTTDNGRGPIYEIMESQTRIQGWFEHAFAPPKPEKESEVGLYSLEFDYGFNFDCPETISLYAPIAVHNQLLPREFMAELKPIVLFDALNEHGSITNEALDNFVPISATERRFMNHPGIPIPNLDDWLGDRILPNGYTTVVRALINVSEHDRQKLLNLKQLSKRWSLNPILLEYIRRSRGGLKTAYKSLFHISVYRWNEMLDQEHIEVDNDLNVYYRRGKLSLSDNYHVVIQFLYETPLLDDGAWDIIRDFPCMFKLLVWMYAPEILVKYQLSLDSCKLNPSDPSPGGDGSGNDPIIYPPIEWPPNYGGGGGGWTPGEWDPETGQPIKPPPYIPNLPPPIDPDDVSDPDIIDNIIKDVDDAINGFRDLNKPSVLWRLVSRMTVVAEHIEESK